MKAWAVIDGDLGELLWICGMPAIFKNKKKAQKIVDARNLKPDTVTWLQEISDIELSHFLVASQVRVETVRQIQANEILALNRA